MFKFKKIIIIFIFILFNLILTFTLTNLLGIYNIIILKSYCFVYHDITWEFIIFMMLSLIESFIYEYKYM